jgi:acyl-CoA synthetase (NDP forming)
MPEITYRSLQRGVNDLTRVIARNNEAIQRQCQILIDEAVDTMRTADQIGAVKVDKATVGETQQVGKVMLGLSNAVGEFSAAQDNTAKRAQAVHDSNHRSHDGVNEAVNASPVGQEIFLVHRDWFTQE